MLRRKLRKIMSTVLAAAVALSSLSVAITASAAETTFEHANMTAVFDSDTGTLTISGTGAMKYVVPFDLPWATGEVNFKGEDVKTVIVNEGITDVESLGSLPNATYIQLPKSATTIGGNTFVRDSNPDLILDIKGQLSSLSVSSFTGIAGTVYVYDTVSYDKVLSYVREPATVVLRIDDEEIRENIRQYIDDFYAMFPREFYTEESYTSLFGEVLAKGEALLAQDTVTAEEAVAYQNELDSVRISNYTKLVTKIKAAIDAANALGTSSYTTSSIAVLQQAIADAGVVDAKSNREKTVEEVNAVLAALVEASTIDETGLAETGLKKKASSAKVNEFNKHYEKSVTSNNGYTEDTWTEYKKVLDEYIAVYGVRETDATDQQIDKVMAALDEAAKKLVALEANLDEYNKAKKAAEDIINSENLLYTAKSFDNLKAVYAEQTALVEGVVGVLQGTVNAAVKALNNAVNSLVEKGDVTNLAELVEAGKAYIESDYTAASWKALSSALATAEGLVNDPDNAGKDAIAAAEEAVRSAIDALVIDYSEGEAEAIGYVQKKAVVSVLDKGTADDAMAGAKTVRVTFDCAADVSYNQYASIEVQALVNGVESYQKFAGTGDYTAGTKGWVVELPLTNAIASGNSYEVNAFTASWDGAADYVYAVTKVEYLDADGNVVKTVASDNETVKLDRFNDTVANAKAVLEEADGYTEESVKALEDAIAAADKLLEESNGKPLPSQMAEAEAAIAAAIEGLTPAEEPTEPTEPDDPDIPKIGDVSGDGVISTVDVGIINSCARGVKELTPEQFVLADVNGDGKVTTVDVGLVNAHAKGVSSLW